MSTTSVPLHVLEYIAQALYTKGDSYTLTQLARVSKGAYEVTAPWLYRNFVITRRSQLILDLGELNVVNVPDGHGDTDHFQWLQRFDLPSRRRLAALARVRRITVASIPPDGDENDVLATAAAAVKSTGRLLFPRAKAVCILPTAVDQLSLWEGNGSLPPLLETLKVAVSPTHLCVAFHLVPATEYLEHRHEVRASYARLPRRIASLANEWALKSATFHDLVWQQLPNLRTTNIYDFAPPAMPHPLFRDRWFFPNLVQEERVNLSGPGWIERVDQIQGVVLRSLIAMRSDGDEAWEQTRWVFCGSERHLQSQTAVGHPAVPSDRASALDMVRRAYRTVIPENVLAVTPTSWSEHGVYRAAEVCEACGRDRPVSTMDSMDPLLMQQFVQGMDFAF